jgi:hypothetical protein
MMYKTSIIPWKNLTTSLQASFNFFTITTKKDDHHFIKLKHTFYSENKSC